MKRLNSIFLLTLFIAIFVFSPIVRAETENEAEPETETEISPTRVIKRPAMREYEIKPSVTGVIKRALIKNQEAFKDQIEKEREDAQATREKEREELKTKLAEISDEKKAELVATIATKINDLNASRMAQYEKILTNLSSILERIQTKAEAAKAAGTDTTALDNAISSAAAIIETSQDAVTAQAGKVYTIDFTSESNLGTAVQKTFSEFRTDIKSVHVKVKAAHDSLITAARGVGKSKKESEIEPSEKPSDAKDTTVSPGAEEEVNTGL